MKKLLIPFFIAFLLINSPHADAARLFTSGFELNSITDGVEFSTNSATVQITTTHPRSGTYDGRVSGSSNGFWRQNVFASDQGTIGYNCAAIYIHASVNASTQLLRWSTVGNVSVGNITLKTDDTLVLLKSNGVQIGSASSALSHDTWYYVCLKNDATAATGTLTGTIQQDGGSITTFATGANSNKGSFGRALLGIVTGTQTTADVYFDDWKVNDNSGSNETGAPANGNVVITRPAGAGESTQWTIGGSSPAATNWQGVSEVTPDDAITLNSDALTSNTDLYTVSSLGLHSYDTINLVQVGARFNNPTADATTNFKYEIEKTSGGTLLQTSSITPNSTTWRTNTIATPDTYALTAYTDPDGAAWTGGAGGTLDSMRIGAVTGTIGVFGIQLTTMWAYVDYTPGTAPVSTSMITGFLLFGDW